MEKDLEELGRLYDLFMISMKAIEQHALVISAGGRADSFWDLVFEVRNNRRKISDARLTTVLARAHNMTASAIFIDGNLLLARFKSYMLHWQKTRAPIIDALPNFLDHCHLLADVQSIIRARQERRIDDQTFIEQMGQRLSGCRRAVMEFQYAWHDLDAGARRWRREHWGVLAAVLASALGIAGLATALVVTDEDRKAIWT